MGNIVLLDELTINKIAAGEVIERPASVVKELMENSIDAGATKISVEVKSGGIAQIKIVDNGSGLNKDDLEYAFERHATSKIRKADDLEHVKSMGFRGEALASIVAISNVEMITKTKDSDVAQRIIVEAGKIREREEIGFQDGTTINVTNLFFNTPVRYKFLKKDFTELGYIEDAITRIALANPNIAIKLTNGNKILIQTTGNGNIGDVIYSIYGKEVAEGLILVDYAYEDIRVRGVIGKPEIARGNRAYQMFYVNSRYVKDKTLSSAAEQAFKGLLQIGKFGFLVLNIEIDSSKIDVNVHPAKLEIRFQEEQKVFKAVYHSIKDSLLKGNLIEKVQFEVSDKTQDTEEHVAEIQENIVDNSIEKINYEIPEKQDVVEEPKVEQNEIRNSIEELYNKKLSGEPEEFKLPSEEKVDLMTNLLNTKNENKEQVKIEEKFDKMYQKTFGKILATNKEKDEITNISVFEDSEVYTNETEYKYIGALFSTYIVIEMATDVYIIDQHAAHERITYEKVKENFYNDEEKDSQIMLLPDIIQLSHKEETIVKENTELFKKAGFIFEEFGENTIRLIGVPTICMELDTKELFKEILDNINTVAITAIQEKEDKFISTIACKASVKANMKLTKEEVDSLMKRLLKLPNPFTCPHGRPTAIKMNKYDIERKFGRK